MAAATCWRRQSTPEESRRQDLMQENLLRLQELRYDQMVLSEQSGP